MKAVSLRKAPKAGALPSARKSTRGVVEYCVAESPGAPAGLVGMIQEGLPYRELVELRECLSVPVERLVPWLGISKATLHRHKTASDRLSPAVSDRVVRYARLLGHAARVFEDLDSAKRWLGAPQVGLGGAIPLDYAKSEIGAREVENLLGRIEFGVYS